MTSPRPWQSFLSSLDVAADAAAVLDVWNASGSETTELDASDPGSSSPLDGSSSAVSAPKSLSGSVACTLVSLVLAERCEADDEELEEIAQKFVIPLLADVAWTGLGAILEYTRFGKVPESILPHFFRAAARLLRATPGASTAAVPPSPTHNSSSSSSSSQLDFRTGAFRDHPSSWFHIGPDGGLRLTGRGQRWGQLRGYAFCAWIQLERSRVGPGEAYASRQLFRFANTQTGASCETYLTESSDPNPGSSTSNAASSSSNLGATHVRFLIRSRTSSKSAWTTVEGPVSVGFGRWHFIVVAHVRPYLLGRAKVAVFVDGQPQPAVSSGSVPYPTAKEMDDCVLGDGLMGCLGAPALFEGGDVTSTEAVLLSERVRVVVDPPHVVGARPPESRGGEEEMDDEDDFGTGGLGYGRDDAADTMVEAGDLVMEVVARVGLTNHEEDRASKRVLVFSFDPRSSLTNGNPARCPELVIRGARRARRDPYVELTPDQGAEVVVSDLGSSLTEEEGETDAWLLGDCAAVWNPESARKEGVDLAGGARAFLLAVRDAPKSCLGEALMLLGDALHADSHLRATFAGVEGFSLLGRELRRRDDLGLTDGPDVVVQVILHMMRSPTSSKSVAAGESGTGARPGGIEREFFCTCLRDVLLDSRAAPARLSAALRLVAGLAAERPRWVREAVGVEGLLRVLAKLERESDQIEFVHEVLHHVWSDATASVGEMGPTVSEVSAALSFVVERSSDAGACALVQELKRLLDEGNVQAKTSLASMGGSSYVLRLGMFCERNVKNPVTGAIVRDADVVPALVDVRSGAPEELRAALIGLAGALMKHHALNAPTSIATEQEVVLEDVHAQLALILAGLTAVTATSEDELTVRTTTKASESVVRACREGLPMPHGIAVWARLAQDSSDTTGVALMADHIRRSPNLCRSIQSLKGWQHFFIPMCGAPGAMGAAAKSALFTIVARADTPFPLDELKVMAPASVWTECVKHVLIEAREQVHPMILSRALILACAVPFEDHETADAFYAQCLDAAEYHRGNEEAGSTSWLPGWKFISHVLPLVQDIVLVAAFMRYVSSVTTNELARPTAEHRRAVMIMLRVASSVGFDQLPAGPLRAELCMGIMQTYKLDEQGNVAARLEEELDEADSMQNAVRVVVDELTKDITVPVVAVNLGTTSDVYKIHYDVAPPRDFVFPEQPVVWTQSRSTLLEAPNMPPRVRRELKLRAVEDLRRRLASRVTDRVRDERFDGTWFGMTEEDGAERVALMGETLAHTLDESFAEKVSRLRRRLLPVSAKEGAPTVLPYWMATSQRRARASSSLPASTTTPTRSSPSVSAETGERDLPLEDWKGLGEKLARRLEITNPLSVSSEGATEEGNASSSDNKSKPLPAEPGTPGALSLTTPATETFVEARVKKMSLEEWVIRPPLSIRGELEARWIDDAGGERSLVAARCFLVRAQGEAPGRLVVSTQAIYFDPDPPGAEGFYFEPDADKVAMGEVSKSDGTKRAVQTRALQEPRRRWSARSVQRVLLRRYRMLESAMEIFLRGDASTSYFLRFEDVHQPNKRPSRLVRDALVKAILSILPRAARDRSQRPGSDIRSLVEPATQAWRSGALCNFDYLMELNLLAGRSVHDLCQYPVFPWVLADYESETIDLEDAASYRDLSKAMGALDPKRLEQFIERYESFDDPNIPKFMFGSHYSTAAGVVLHFLVRLEPFRSLHVDMHDGRYDVPDRLFTSVPSAYKSSATSADLGEVKEITPEFYYLPATFENRGRFDLGKSQDGVAVGDVDLPPWAKNSAHEFVRVMRDALESNITSASLHRWIDLIFGFAQRGPQAVKAHNVFYYLTYPGAVNIEAEKDPFIRRAAELQIAHFGQCPDQLEPRHPWPARERNPGKSGAFALRKRADVETFFHVDEVIPTVAARVVRRAAVITSVPEEDAELDDAGGGGLIALRADGCVVALARPPALQDPVSLKNAQLEQASALKGVHRPELAAWSHDGSLLISIGRAAVGTIELTLLEVGRGEGTFPAARGTLFAHEEPVTALAFDDGLLVSGAADGSARLWRVGRAGALRRAAVWTAPRRFLRGHVVGEPVLCAAACRVMGVVATASRHAGVICHDALTGRVLWSKRLMESGGLVATSMAFDRCSGSLLIVASLSSSPAASASTLVCVNIDGTVSATAAMDERVTSFFVVAPGTVIAARATGVDVVELPSLIVQQSWPLPEVVAVAPGPFISKNDRVDDHVIVNLVTKDRSVWCLRRTVHTGVGGSAVSKLLGAMAPTVVVGKVSSAVSGATRGSALIGALDNVRKGVDVGKGVAGEAWELLSSTANTLRRG